jgi:hypothetical protein
MSAHHHRNLHMYRCLAPAGFDLASLGVAALAVDPLAGWAANNQHRHQDGCPRRCGIQSPYRLGFRFVTVKVVVNVQGGSYGCLQARYPVVLFGLRLSLQHVRSAENKERQA